MVINIQVSSKWCPSIKVTTADFTEKIALVQITAVVWLLVYCGRRWSIIVTLRTEFTSSMTTQHIDTLKNGK